SIAQKQRTSLATRPLIELFGSILRRGAETGDFAADVHTGKCFAAMLGMVTSCFLTGHVTSTYLNFDLTSDEGISEWRDYAIDLLLKALRPGSNQG
ncbi:MAG: hypothetical protein KGO02_15695, partial [Alphaproteobacteria bacterium]|nr:hypothetical protein [Alphaproteobacteria bacterium]